MTDVPAAPTLALDIGGTKIAAGLVDAEGQVLQENRQPTPADADPEQVWAAAERAIAEALAAAGGTVSGAGISSAGPIDLAAGTISPVNIAAWRGFPVRDRVAAAVPGVPVRLAGDGLCMALGEHWRGAGQGAAFLLGMVVSTGIGGGLVLDGVPYDGRTGNAGHVGHVVVDIDGPACSCGGRGCVEAIASGPHLVAWARSQGWAGADARELAAAAAAGDAVAVRAFDRGGRAIVLSPKVNPSNWRGAEIVTLDDAGGYADISQALADIEQEKRDRIGKLRRGEPLEPLTIVYDEIGEMATRRNIVRRG